MTAAEWDYDLYAIGAGSGGVRAARMAAATGARVAVAEADALGGTCVNVGCVPKKLMVYAARFRDDFEDAAGFGWSVGETRFDWGVMKANRDREIQRLNGIYDRLLRNPGCDIHHGRARVIDPHTVEVTPADGGPPTRHTARNILVATGGRPVRPDIPGAEHAWISDDIFSLDTQPRRLLVVGGGYIAVEMACIFDGLGTEVTLVHRGASLLRGFDAEVSRFLGTELTKRGLDVRYQTEVQSLTRRDDGVIEARMSDGGCLEVDAVFHAIGRRPNTAGLGLEEAGVELGAKGKIVVDEHYRTSVPSIFALGDVTDRFNLTPVALTEAMALVKTLFGEGPATVDYDHLATAVFSIPPLATVGMTEEAARDRFDEVHVYASDFRPMKHTMSGRDERTLMKLIVDAATDRVVGVHIVGSDGPEMIQTVAVAMKCGATKAQFDATIGLHPTAAEELVTMRQRRPES